MLNVSPLHRTNIYHSAYTWKLAFRTSPWLISKQSHGKEIIYLIAGDNSAKLDAQLQHHYRTTGERVCVCAREEQLYSSMSTLVPRVKTSAIPYKRALLICTPSLFFFLHYIKVTRTLLSWRLCGQDKLHEHEFYNSS